MGPAPTPVSLGADPLVLVPGDPDGVQSLAEFYADRAGVFDDAQVALGRLDLSGWTGAGARAGTDRIEAARTAAGKAASAYASAARALSEYGWTLAWAQGQAKVAIDRWNRGRYCTPGQPVGWGAPALNADQQEALAILDHAQVSVQSAAARAAQVLQDAAGYAPINPGFFNSLGYYASQMATGAFLDPFTGLADGGRAFLADPSTFLTGVLDLFEHPLALGDAVSDSATWRDSPARAIGHVLPDAALALTGIGTAAVAARRAGKALEVAEAAEPLAAGSTKYTVTQLAAETAGHGPVVFKARPDLTSAEIAGLKEYVDVGNEIRLDGELSATGRVSTAGDLRDLADRAASAERARAAEAGTPYQGVVGHGIDTTWTGDPVPRVWLDQTSRLNSSLGGQVGRYPLGYTPTIFRASLPDGTSYPPVTEGGVP